MKKRYIIILAIFLAPLTIFSQSKNADYLSYIKKYKAIAVEKQYRHGIPASITLAQGILESQAGQSMLAVKAKNHFGIKCGSGWTGKTIEKDDDRPNDCFRSYNEVSESFEDHSVFLKRDRYATLFKIPIKDYRAWANELKRLGYATDPNYANKLIKIIEDYNLNDIIYENNGTKNDNNTSQTKTKTTNNSVDYSNLLTKTTNNSISCFKLNRNATITDVANAINKPNSRTTLLFYNDMYEDFKLNAGTFIYTTAKKNKTISNTHSYTIKAGDSMHSIAQQFGIKLKALYKLNDMTYGREAIVGTTLFLK